MYVVMLVIFVCCKGRKGCKYKYLRTTTKFCYSPLQKLTKIFSTTKIILLLAFATENVSRLTTYAAPPPTRDHYRVKQTPAELKGGVFGGALPLYQAA